MLTCDKHLHNVACNLKLLASTPKSQPSYRNWKISSLDSRHDYRKFRESRIKNTQVLRIKMRVTVNLLLGGTLQYIYTGNVKENNNKHTCRVEQSLKLLQEILHQMHNLQTSQLSACTNCQYLTDYNLHLPCTLYVVLISRLFIQHIANMLLANLPLCTLQYLPLPPPTKKKNLHNLSFSFLQRTMYYSHPKEKLKTKLMQIFREEIRYITRDVQVENKKKK